MSVDSARRDGLDAVETLVGDSETAAPRTAALLERGAVVGRYVVLDELGHGGMGVVYAAFDPGLDRKVAIKLLRGRAGGSVPADAARLVREAQAMAKLSHPNVVTVHDVGTVGDDVFVAMEFVEGVTLRAWASAEPRTWRRIVDVMLRAGRGLVAAHDAGLIHGDFKPDNVMIAADGRVRVMDFGLAYRAEDVSVDSNDGSSTQLGKRMVVGTPGYVAPERLAGTSGDARADQFAFAVTLWELLYGQLPWSGTTALEIATRVLDGELAPAPRGAKVPSWVRAATTRALATDREERFPTMAEMLDALDRDPSRLRRRVAAAVAVVSAAAAVLGWQHIDRARTEAACEDRGAELSAIWNDERREEVRAAVIASGDGNATTTADKLLPWLDRYATEWSATSTEVCLAATRDGTVSADHRRSADECLDEGLLDFEELVAAFARANAEIARAAVRSASALDLAPCSDPRALAQRMAMPADASERDAVHVLRRKLSRSDALYFAGLHEDALAEASSVRDEAAREGWRSLAAVAALRAGRALERAGRYDEAIRTLQDAYFEAGAIGADEIAEDAAIQLVATFASRLVRRDDALLWAEHARMLRERRGESAESLRSARLDHYLGAIASDHDDRKAALEYHTRALEVRERLLGAEHPEVASSLLSVSELEQAEGRYADSRRYAERALEVYEQAYGPEHLEVAVPLTFLGIAVRSLGSHEQALVYFERALAIRERSLGLEHILVASSLNNVAITCRSLGRVERALELHRRALAIREKTFGANHPDVAESLQNTALALLAFERIDEALPLLRRALAITEDAYGERSVHFARGLVNLGNALSARNDLDEAGAVHGRALAIWEEHFGAEHPEVARTLVNMAVIARKRGHYDEARELAGRSLAIRERTLGPDHPYVAYTLVDLAGVELDSGRPAEAVPLLERALAIEVAVGSNPPVIAAGRFALARALAETNTDLPRARALAEQAREAFRSDGSASAQALAEVERWLAARR